MRGLREVTLSYNNESHESICINVLHLQMIFHFFAQLQAAGNTDTRSDHPEKEAGSLKID